MLLHQGLSEPNSGSDVFAASTRATKTDGGWLVNGRKIWTSNAHKADYMIGLLRTSNKTPENHRHGLDAIPDRRKWKSPGITIRPDHQPGPARAPILNEVVFDDVFVPDLHGMIGEVGHGLEAEPAPSSPTSAAAPGPLARAPCRAWSSWCASSARSRALERQAEGIGREVAHLALTMRRSSVAVGRGHAAGRGNPPAPAEASIVKDLGTRISSRRCPSKVRLMAPVRGDSDPDSNDDRFEQALNYTTLIAPKLTIQGGTREILRGIIARGLGLR